MTYCSCLYSAGGQLQVFPRTDHQIFLQWPSLSVEKSVIGCWSCCVIVLCPTEDVAFNLDRHSSHYMIVIILLFSMASYLISQHALFPRRPT